MSTVKRHKLEKDVDMEMFARLLQKRADEKGLSKSEVAYKCGVNQLTVVRWFNGGFLPRNFTMMKRLIEILEITTEDLVECGFKLSYPQYGEGCGEDKKEDESKQVNMVPLIKAIEQAKLENLSDKVLKELIRIYKEGDSQELTPEAIRWLVVALR